MAEEIENDNRAINEEYGVDEIMLDKEKLKQYFYRKVEKANENND